SQDAAGARVAALTGPDRGCIKPSSYLTKRLSKDADRPAERNVRRDRRPHETGDPRPSGRRPGVRHRARGAFRYEPSRGLEAPEGARARLPDVPGPRRAVAAV